MITNGTAQELPAATWTTLIIDTEVLNNVAGASLVSNQVTLPAGTYVVTGRANCIRSNDTRLRLRNVTDNTIICSGMAVWSGNATGTGVGAFAQPTLFGTFVLASSKVLDIQQRGALSSSAFTDNGGLGDPGTLGYNSRTCEFTFEKIA